MMKQLGRPIKLRYLGDSDASVPKGAVCAPIGGKNAIRLCMTRTKKVGPALTQPLDVCQYLTSMGKADRESIVAVLLDARNRVIGTEEIAKGSVSGVDVHPREMFKSAVLANASAIILAHNHPSGDNTPSRADISLTNNLVAAGNLMGIKILDHMIVTDQACTSLRKGGVASFDGARGARKKPGKKPKKRR